MRTLFLISILFLNGSLGAQELKPEPQVKMYLEVFANGVRDFDGVGISPVDLSSTLGYGWGLGLQTSLFLDSGFGLVWRISNDFISLDNGFEDEEMEDNLPKAIRQSIYQGLAYRAVTNEKQGNYVEGTVGFGWTRYRMPTVKFKSGFSYQWRDVSGFSASVSLGYGYQYSKRSSVKIYLSSALDFLDHEYSPGGFSQEVNGVYFIHRLSIGHVTRL